MRIRWLFIVLCFWRFSSLAAEASFEIKAGDVVAWLGGANVVAAQETGHVETLLTLAYPDAHARFRSLAWTADTVYSQPRDLNYPSITNQLQKIGATVVICQFGQGEAFSGVARLEEFRTAYGRLLDGITSWNKRRILLVTPTAFQSVDGPGANPARRNGDLERYASAVLELGRARNLPVVDLFALTQSPDGKLTSDGFQLTTYGHGRVAQLFIGALGFSEIADRVGAIDSAGRFVDPVVEQIRQRIIRKNELWFNYSRPTNWAFLAGDRTEQPSSRDHRDPKIRWFPAELEQFVPLISNAEEQIRDMVGRNKK